MRVRRRRMDGSGRRSCGKRIRLYSAIPMPETYWAGRFCGSGHAPPQTGYKPQVQDDIEDCGNGKKCKRYN